MSKRPNLTSGDLTHNTHQPSCKAVSDTLRVTPAMAAGVTDKLWDFNDIVALID